MTAIWKEKSFNQLTLDEMYQLLSLRTAVFVVEQNCPYQELDGKDQVAKHLWLENENGQLMGPLSPTSQRDFICRGFNWACPCQS